jgi:hypothetical protein
MGVKTLRSLLGILFFFAGATTAATAAKDPHAVTGAVVTPRSDNKSPVQNVQVTIYTKYGDAVTSGRSDAVGKYLLLIPDPPQQYMIHYRHDDYLEEIRGLIDNNNNHIFDDVELIPATVSNKMTPEELDRYVNQLVALGKLGRERGVAVFADVAQRNLLRLRSAFSPTSEAGARVQEHINSALRTTMEPPSSNPFPKVTPPEGQAIRKTTPAPPMLGVTVKPPKP